MSNELINNGLGRGGGPRRDRRVRLSSEGGQELGRESERGGENASRGEEISAMGR